jgi:hypothetical protein
VSNEEATSTANDKMLEKPNDDKVPENKSVNSTDTKSSKKKHNIVPSFVHSLRMKKKRAEQKKDTVAILLSQATDDLITPQSMIEEINDDDIPTNEPPTIEDMSKKVEMTEEEKTKEEEEEEETSVKTPLATTLEHASSPVLLPSIEQFEATKTNDETKETIDSYTTESVETAIDQNGNVSFLLSSTALQKIHHDTTISRTTTFDNAGHEVLYVEPTKVKQPTKVVPSLRSLRCRMLFNKKRTEKTVDKASSPITNEKDKEIAPVTDTQNDSFEKGTILLAQDIGEHPKTDFKIDQEEVITTESILSFFGINLRKKKVVSKPLPTPRENTVDDCGRRKERVVTTDIHETSSCHDKQSEKDNNAKEEHLNFDNIFKELEPYDISKWDIFGNQKDEVSSSFKNKKEASRSLNAEDNQAKASDTSFTGIAFDWLPHFDFPQINFGFNNSNQNVNDIPRSLSMDHIMDSQRDDTEDHIDRAKDDDERQEPTVSNGLIPLPDRTRSLPISNTKKAAQKHETAAKESSAVNFAATQSKLETKAGTKSSWLPPRHQPKLLSKKTEQKQNKGQQEEFVVEISKDYITS